MTDRHRDRGFTLVELIISVVILGIVMVVISSLFLVILRTPASAKVRADDARSLLAISTWLPNDVASVPRLDATDVDVPTYWSKGTGDPLLCAGVSTAGSVSVLSLRWLEKSGSTTTTYVANYRVVDENGWRLKRFTCSGTGSTAPFGTAVTVNVSTELPDPASTPITVNWKIINGQIAGVEMILTTFDGDTLRVDAASNNLNETLTGNNTSNTTSTSVPVNNPPSVADLYTTIELNTSAVLTLPVTDPDVGDTITITVVASDAELVAVSPAPGGLDITVTADSTSGASVGEVYVLTYEADDGTDVVPGKVTVSVVASPATTTTSTSSTTTSTSSTTTTTIPCTASFSSVIPDPAYNEVNGAGNDQDVAPLQVPVIVTITKSGNCSDLVLSYQPNSGGSGTIYTLTFGAGNNQTLPAIASQRWRDGTRTLRLVDVGRALTLDNYDLEVI